MQLVLTGASGFIGSVLCARLLQAGHSLVLLTHGAPANTSTAEKRWIHWTPEPWASGPRPSPSPTA